MTTKSSVLAAAVVPRSTVARAVLVVGFALLTAAAAQLVIPLPFTPVPITGQTFAVLLAGGVLGSRAGALSQVLYVTLGTAGLPFFQGGNGGWTYATGSTLGYLVGFVAAAYLVGLLAERKQDRSVWSAVPMFLAGNAVIYVAGVTWLAGHLGVSATRAMELGLVPFVIGDLVKIAAAGLVLPAAWKLVGALKR